MTSENVWYIDVHPNSEKEAARIAAECLRVPPFGESCTLGRNHDGPCDWYTATPADRAAARERAARP